MPLSENSGLSGRPRIPASAIPLLEDQGIDLYRYLHQTEDCANTNDEQSQQDYEHGGFLLGRNDRGIALRETIAHTSWTGIDLRGSCWRAIVNTVSSCHLRIDLESSVTGLHNLYGLSLGLSCRSRGWCKRSLNLPQRQRAQVKILSIDEVRGYISNVYVYCRLKPGPCMLLELTICLQVQQFACVRVRRGRVYW